MIRITIYFFSLTLFLIVNGCKLFKNEKVSLDLGLRPPVMGWSSWNNFRLNINEDIVKSQADAIINLGLADVGYQFINIDEGYFGGRGVNGELLFNTERFSHGMKNLAGYIHSKGLKAGIYSDAGVNSCASHWQNDTIGTGMGLYGHEEQDLQLFLEEWNYDFLKVDWCGGELLGLDEQTRYTQIGSIAKQIKPSVVYNVCRWKFPGEWVIHLADSWRISGDIRANFESVMHIVDLNAGLWRYCTKGHYNDMDMLQVGRGMTDEEDKTHFSMWCMMQSPLILGNDLTQISEQTLKIITNEDIIALNQSPFVYQARRIIDFGELEIWAKPLVSTMSGEVAVALLNRSEEPQPITINLELIGIEAGKGYTIKDLWSKEKFGMSKETEISREVPSHGVVVLKIEGIALPYNFFQFSDTEKL